MNDKPRNLKSASPRANSELTRELAREVALTRAMLEEAQAVRDRHNAAGMLWAIAFGVGGLVYSVSLLVDLPFRISPELAIGASGFVALVSLVLAIGLLQRLALWNARERDVLELAKLEQQRRTSFTKKGS